MRRYHRDNPMPSTSASGPSYPEVAFSLFAEKFDFFVNSDVMPLSSGDVIDNLLYKLNKVLNSDSKSGAVFDDQFRLHVSLYDIPSVAIRISGKDDDSAMWSEEDFLTANDKFLLITPFFKGELKNCCILPTLRLALALNNEYKKCEFDDSLRGYPKSADWRSVFQINHADLKCRISARMRLYEKTLEWCEEMGIVPQDYANLDNLENLKDLAEKMKVNLFLYDQEFASMCIFQAPEVFDPKLPTISVLLMPTGNGTKHASVIRNYSKFFHQSGSIRCHYCGRNYSSCHYPYHSCTGAELCNSCRRVKIKPAHYTDYQIVKQGCTSLIRKEQEEECSDCKTICKNSQCRKAHKR